MYHGEAWLMKFPGMWLINPYSTDVWNMTRTGNLSMEFLKAPHRFPPHDAAVIEILGILLTSVTRSFLCKSRCNLLC